MKASFILPRIVLVFFLFFTAGPELRAQSVETQDFKANIALHPFCLINGGMRFDYEHPLMKESSHWIQYSIMAYYLPERKHAESINDPRWFREHDAWENFLTNFAPISSLSGMGLGVAYKYFFRDSYLLQGPFYLSPALNYTFFHVGYNEFTLAPFYEEGLRLWEYGFWSQNQDFHKFKTELNIGVQRRFSRRLFVDCFMGIGWDYSLSNRQNPYMKKTMYALGYSGWTLTLGFRLGGILGKDTVSKHYRKHPDRMINRVEIYP